MKWFLLFFSLLIVLLTTSYFNMNQNDLPELNDFTYKEEYEYEVDQVFKLIIDSCLAIVEINFVDTEMVTIVDAYHLEEKLQITFNKETMRIDDLNEALLCKNKSDINHYLLITLPQHLIELNIEVNSFYTSIEGNGLNYNHLNIKVDEGKLVLKNSNIQSFFVELFKGDIHLKHLTSEIANIYVTNGMIEFEKSEIRDIIDIKLHIGDITLNDISTKEMISKVTLGDTNISNSTIIETTKITNDFGDINLIEVYSEKVYLKLDEGNISYQNQNELSYIPLLEYSIRDGEVNFSITGNIVKV